MSTKATTINSGEFRLRIKLIDPNDGFSADGFGGGEDGEEAVKETVWGKLGPQLKPEIFDAEQLRGQLPQKISIRSHSAVRALDLVKLIVGLGARRFKVLAVLARDERNFVIDLACVELPANG